MTKRLTLLITLLVVSCSLTQAQTKTTYYIIAMKGKIYNQTTKKYLKPRTKISSEDKVVFKDKNSIAVLYSKGKGRFKLRLRNKNTSSEAAIWVKKTLFSQKNNAITRANTRINSVTELRAHFKKAANKYLILGDKLQLNINPAVFARLGKGQPYIRYTYKGNPVNKAVKYKNGVLTIDKKELFKVDGEDIQPEEASNFIISYYVAEKESSVYLDSPESQTHLKFKPVFVAESALEDNGVKALAEYMKSEKVKEDEAVNEIAAAMAEIGTANPANIRTWFKANYK